MLQTPSCHTAPFKTKIQLAFFPQPPFLLIFFPQNCTSGLSAPFRAWVEKERILKGLFFYTQIFILELKEKNGKKK